MSPGFASLEFTVKPTDVETDNRNPQELTPVYVKVPRIPGELTTPGHLPKPSTSGPNVVLWTFHGDDHDGGSISPSEDYDRSGDGVQKNWKLEPSNSTVKRLSEVKTLIVTGCSVLDINDYNNGFAAPTAIVNAQYAGWC